MTRSSNSLSASALALTLSLSGFGQGCADARAAPPPRSPPPAAPQPPPAPAPVATSPTPPPKQTPSADEVSSIHRLDFVLTVTEGKSPLEETSFSLTALEHNNIELHIGKNVPLLLTQAAGTSPGSLGVPRTDVGTKVKAKYRMNGDSLLVDVLLELSSADPPAPPATSPTLRKLTTMSSALASPGKATVVATIDTDRAHYRLTVTPTRIR